MPVTNMGVAPGIAADRRLVSRRFLLPTTITADFSFQDGVLLRDLSETGLGGQAIIAPVVGSTAKCAFRLPDAGHIEAMGTVAWNDSSGRFGLHFDQVGDVERARLTEWLSRVSTRSAVEVPASASPARDVDDLSAIRQQLQTGRLSADAAMQVLADSLRAITGASGVAVATECDGAIVCRASSGTAPQVGAHVDPQAGLTGECVRSGEVVRCADTEADPRADRVLCRKLELRSVVVVPVVRNNRVVGIVEAFSSSPHAFQNNAVRLLQKAAQVIHSLAWSDAAAAMHPKPAAAPPASPKAGRSQATPVVPAPAVPGGANEAKTAVEAKPAAEQKPPSSSVLVNPPGAAPPVRVAKPVQPAPMLAPKAVEEPKRTAAPAVPPRVSAPAVTSPADRADAVVAEFRARKLAELAAAQTAADKKALEKVQAAQRPEAKNRFQEFDFLEQPARRRFPWRTAILVALALMIALLVWQLWPKSTVPAQAAPSSSGPRPATAPSAAVSGRVDKIIVTPGPAVAETARRPAAKRAQVSVADNVLLPAGSPETSKPLPVADAPPPALPASAERNGAVSSLLANSVPQPVLSPDLPRSTGVTGGTLKRKVDPTYPPAARALNISGTVVVNATVDTNGRVVRVKTVSGNPLLASAATAAIRRWVYDPFRLNGKAIQGDTRITIDFNAP